MRTLAGTRTGFAFPNSYGSLSAEQCPCSVGDEVRALLWHPVAAPLDDFEGQIDPVDLDLLEHRHRDIEVIGAEQHLGRSLQPLSLECAPQNLRRSRWLLETSRHGFGRCV